MSRSLPHNHSITDAQFARLNPVLAQMARVVDWEGFRPALEDAWATEKTSPAGRKPWDFVLMFKVIMLCALNNLSTNRAERLIADSLSWRRFLGLGLCAPVPDESTIWKYRNVLAVRDAIWVLFAELERQLVAVGLAAKGGQLVDSSWAPVPMQRNTREENAQIKEGKVPDEWKANPSKLRQKDTDATHAKKNGHSCFGFKNHVNVDAEHKLIRGCVTTPASEADVRVLPELLRPPGAAPEVYADRAYWSKAVEAMLAERGYTSRVMRRGTKQNPLTDEQKEENKRRSRVRVRVEHVFGSIRNELAGSQVRCIGIVRATALVGLKNLAYNMRRMVTLLNLRSA